MKSQRLVLGPFALVISLALLVAVSPSAWVGAGSVRASSAVRAKVFYRTVEIDGL